MSNISKRRREGSRSKIKSMGDHKVFLRRITKTLYYGQLPSIPCLSLPVTEVSCALWSCAQRGRSLRRLHADAAASIAHSAAVSPCALVLAILYLERLNACNPEYLAAIPPADLFLVSLMVGNKFLQDDGEDDDVICAEWAASGGLELKQLKKLEVEFLDAIDWNVFVSDKSFEEGLIWLEREVALKQAHLRGFFTYADLAAAGDAALLAAAAAGCALLAAAALLLALLAAPAHTRLRDATVVTHYYQPELTLTNATVEPALLERLIVDELLATDRIKCCTKWLQYSDDQNAQPKRNHFDAIVSYDWKTFEPWWARTSIHNWLYQSSLVSPMQQWLEKMVEYAGLVVQDWIRYSNRVEQCERCERGGPPRCVRPLNVSASGALAVTLRGRPADDRAGRRDTERAVFM